MVRQRRPATEESSPRAPPPSAASAALEKLKVTDEEREELLRKVQDENTSALLQRIAPSRANHLLAQLRAALQVGGNVPPDQRLLVEIEGIRSFKLRVRLEAEAQDRRARYLNEAAKAERSARWVALLIALVVVGGVVGFAVYIGSNAKAFYRMQETLAKVYHYLFHHKRGQGLFLDEGEEFDLYA